MLKGPADQCPHCFGGVTLVPVGRINPVAKLRFSGGAGIALETNQAGAKGILADYHEPVCIPVVIAGGGLGHFGEFDGDRPAQCLGDHSLRQRDVQLSLQSDPVGQVLL